MKTETNVEARDRIVCTLGEFPELTQVVGDGDLSMVSILCAQLFDLNSETKSRSAPAASQE